MVNLRFNHHMSNHTKTCFKKGDEGRCHLPDTPEERTRIHHERELSVVHDWRGRELDHDCTTVRPRRLPQDACTNAHCSVMSRSATPCNSNVIMTTGARSTIHASCYSTKGTQREDSEEFSRMGRCAAARWKETRRDTPLFEGLSRLMGAVMVNTSEHICSAPMAAHILRNGSRFRHSHRFKCIPIRETIDMLCSENGEETMEMSVLSHDKGCFLQNEALNHLLRPKRFEDTSLLDFFQECEVVRLNDQMKDVVHLDDSSHPGHGKQVVRNRKESVLAQFPQWIFSDSATFGGDIVSLCPGTANSQAEKQCLVILMLCVPFRKLSDLQLEGSSYKLFLRLHGRCGVPDEIAKIMGNVQMFYNSTKLPAKHDPLNASTIPFKTPTGDRPSNDTEEEEEEDDFFFDGMFDFMDGNSVPDPSAPEVSLADIRAEGAKGRGFHNLPPPSACSPKGDPAGFVVAASEEEEHQTSRKRNREPDGGETPDLLTLMELTWGRSRRRVDVSRWTWRSWKKPSH